MWLWLPKWYFMHPGWPMLSRSQWDWGPSARRLWAFARKNMQVGLVFQVDNIHEMSYGFSKRQRKKLCKSQYNYLQQKSQYTSFVMFDRTSQIVRKYSVLKIRYMPLTSVSITNLLDTMQVMSWVCQSKWKEIPNALPVIRWVRGAQNKDIGTRWYRERLPMWLWLPKWYFMHPGWPMLSRSQWEWGPSVRRLWAFAK